MSKEKLRTDPSSVRFDKEKLEFIMGREKLTSKQQVIDLLINKYWWEFKAPIPTHKESPPLTLKDPVGESIKPTPNDPNITPYESYKAEIKNAGSSQEIEKIVRSAKGDKSFGKWHKEQIEKYGIEISRTLDF